MAQRFKIPGFNKNDSLENVYKSIIRDMRMIYTEIFNDIQEVASIESTYKRKC